MVKVAILYDILDYDMCELAHGLVDNSSHDVTPFTMSDDLLEDDEWKKYDYILLAHPDDSMASSLPSDKVKLIVNDMVDYKYVPFVTGVTDRITLNDFFFNMVMSRSCCSLAEPSGRPRS